MNAARTEQHGNSPEIQEYLGVESECLKCRQDAQERMNVQMTSPEEPMKITSTPATAIPAAERLVLNRLGIASFPRLPQKNLPDAPEKGEIHNLVERYLDFICSVDLTSARRAIKAFRPSVFCEVLKTDISDGNITLFIRKLMEDPLDYSKQEKAQMLYIFIFAFVYCKRHSLDTRVCRRKIEQLAFLFRPCLEFDLPFCNDPFIDKYIVNMRHSTADISEAVFLNRVYLVRNIDKSMFEVFHRRLVDALCRIPEEHVFSFMKHVFTHSTVLFSCITEAHLYKLVISHYKNVAKDDQLSGLLVILMEKVDDRELNDAFAEHFRGLALNTIKHKKQGFVVEVRGFNSLSEYEGYFLRNRESFNAVMVGLEGLVRVYAHMAGSDRELEILGILFFLFDNIKLEFLEASIRPFNGLVIKALENIRVFGTEFA